MNILILGDSGFIGSETIKTLIKQRRIDSKPLKIIGVDIHSSCEKTPLRNDSDAIYEHIQSNCASSTEENILYTLIRSERPDVIINCAAYVGVDNVKEKSLLVGYNNFNTSYHLCNALSQQRKVDVTYNPLIIFFSSSEVYGNTMNASVKNRIYELYEDTPRGSYAISKLLEENLYNNLKTIDYTNTIIMRLFNIVGETQSKNFVLPTLIECALREESFKVTPTYRCFCHVDFLTDCIYRIIKQYSSLKRTTFPHLTNFTSFREENYTSIPRLVDLASKVMKTIIFTRLKMIEADDIIYRRSETPKIPPMFLDHTKDIPLEEIIRRIYEGKK